MINCPKCGTKNDDDVAFCTNCGVSLRTDVASTIERHAKRFAKDMEQTGKKVGKTMAQTAKKIQEETHERSSHIERRISHASRYTENWYDQRFGILGPLLSSFIFLIIFRLVILIVQSIQGTAEEIRVMSAVAAVLLIYLLPLFCITLLSNYTKYFSKKSYQFRMFSPLFHTIAFVIMLWIVVKILTDLSVRLTLPEMKTAAMNIEQLLPTIFVFILLIGYVVLAMNMPREPERKS